MKVNKLLFKIYRAYDWLMTKLNHPCYYCSQCEKKIRHWVYRLKGLVYCQNCADIKVDKMMENRRILDKLDSIDLNS